jgi:NAD-dependent deacetylase
MISDKLLMALAHAHSVAVLTGAGISAESGVPTFRDPGGLWARFKPEELANFDAFMKNPDLVWEWYSHRREVISSVQPNPGHFALVEMEAMFNEFTLITQNVDNLHARAGSANIIELHGNIERSFCVDCKRWYSDIEAPPSVTGPRCDCGGLIRPDVVWFGEMLPQEAIRKATEAAEKADIFFSIGTSGEVYPAAQLPSIARRNGAYVVEINPGPTAISFQMTECLNGPSGVILPQIMELIRAQRGR